MGENVKPADESRFLSPHGGAEKTPEDVVAAQWAEAGGDEICMLTKYGKRQMSIAMFVQWRVLVCNELIN